MTDYKFVCPEDIEECRQFCLHHARSFRRALPEEIWHYTDANGLIGILQTGKVWATQVSSLNDTLEQRYFGELVHQAVKERKKCNTDSRLELLFCVADEALGNLDFSDVGQFVVCFSEAEDDLGQWRGYGGGECGYAIGFRSQAVLDAIKPRPSALLLPMCYADDIHSFVVAGVIKWAESYFLEALNRDLPDRVAWTKEFVAAFGDALTLIAATVKHPKFSGERERRIAAFLQEGEHGQMIFRQKRTLLARHLPLSLTVEVEGAQRLPITRIYVGPGPSQKASKISVGDLLLQQSYRGVPVEISKVPYRVP